APANFNFAVRKDGEWNGYLTPGARTTFLSNGWLTQAESYTKTTTKTTMFCREEHTWMRLTVLKSGWMLVEFVEWHAYRRMVIRMPISECLIIFFITDHIVKDLIWKFKKPSCQRARTILHGSITQGGNRGQGYAIQGSYLLS
ncbi:hypothetical protein PENTCL1PPCAC_24636, partial [Pristionchus entomophagus]